MRSTLRAGGDGQAREAAGGGQPARLWITRPQEAILAVLVVPAVDDDAEDDEPESFPEDEVEEDDDDDESVDEPFDDESFDDELSEDEPSDEELDVVAFDSDLLSVR
jgi:hypothetical protein